MHHRQYTKGQWLAAAEDPMEHLIVVAAGRLRLVHATGSGREQVVRTLGPGDFLGELALFSPARYEGDLVAATDVEACLLPRDAVQRVIQAHPDVALLVLEALARRLAEAERLIGDLGLRDVGQRLAAELLRLAEDQPERPDGVLVTVPMPWHEIALRLGTTPESLSRRLGSLTDEGVVQQQSGRVLLVRSLERLREIARG